MGGAGADTQVVPENTKQVDEDTVGVRIERIAFARGLAKDKIELAKLLGVSYETLRKWREGITAPSRKHAAHAAEVLGVDAAVFMHGIDASDEPESFDALTGTEGRLIAHYRLLDPKTRAQAAAEIEAKATGTVTDRQIEIEVLVRRLNELTDDAFQAFVAEMNVREGMARRRAAKKGTHAAKSAARPTVAKPKRVRQPTT